MDKCIKVELPTGHILMEKTSEKQYEPSTPKSWQDSYDFTGGDEFNFNECGYDGWVAMWVNGHCWLFKVIAQYGDEFPV